MHRTSHWLGMDVHDVGDYDVDGKPRPLVPGMVLTVEPGLYVAADDADAPEELRGIGIRIEDDILVTAEGHENLTAAVPKEIRGDRGGLRAVSVRIAALPRRGRAGRRAGPHAPETAGSRP